MSERTPRPHGRFPTAGAAVCRTGGRRGRHGTRGAWRQGWRASSRGELLCGVCRGAAAALEGGCRQKAEHKCASDVTLG